MKPPIARDAIREQLAVRVQELEAQLAQERAASVRTGAQLTAVRWIAGGWLRAECSDAREAMARIVDVLDETGNPAR